MGNSGAPASTGFLARFGEISAVIAVTAAAIYSLGLVALWVPIARLCTNDFSTAWYAASLIPRTVVAGQGVRQLVVGPLAFLMITAASILIGGFIINSIRRLFERAEPGPTTVLESIITTGAEIGVIGGVLGGAVGALLYFFTGPLGRGIASSISTTSLTTSVLAIGALFVPALVGLPVGLRMVRAMDFSTGHFFPRIVDPSAIRRSIILGGIVAIVAAFVVATFKQPPLPSVEVNANNPPENGDLLTHTENFWYIFNNEGVLIATPDNSVNKVHVSSNQNSACQG